MSAKSTKSSEQPEFAAIIRRDIERAVHEVVNSSLSKFRDVFIQQLRDRFREHIAPSNELPDKHSSEGTGEWVGIESLSRLRSVVGGRFQNIKKKWTDAGFPLREHRGDRVKGFAVNESAWIELSNWILKQGYEARLTPDNTEFLFELRPLPK